MDSTRNTSGSGKNSVDLPPNGYSLKKYRLKKWIYENGYTQPYVARRMGIEPEEFKRKLRERETFGKWQIWGLIQLMHAEEAFYVLYFPSKRKRRQVRIAVFGNKEKLNE